MSAQSLDLSRLDSWIREYIPPFDGPLAAEKFSGGQSNPTFKLIAGAQHYVLRRKPQGELLASAHAVDREYRVIAALHQTDVPVPRPIVLCEDESIIGSMFYVMEYMDGRVFWDPALPDLNLTERTAIYDEMNRVLAALHNVDINAVGLADFGRPGNYFERQLGRWTKQYRASETETVPAMEQLMTWLRENMPEDDGVVSLVHGDFRIDNLMFHPTEPRIIAILDWELSTLGNPIADIAYQIMAWHFPREGAIAGLSGVDRESIGLPSDEDYVAAYCTRTHRGPIPNWNFYMAFCFFRIAAILQGIKKRVLVGTASSDEAAQRGEQVVPLAELGLHFTTLEG
jgi:aminoglycoside phosphotransferase (APT) family kinase protein